VKILFVRNNNFSDKCFFLNFHFFTEKILFIDKRILCVTFYFQVKIILEETKCRNKSKKIGKK